MKKQKKKREYIDWIGLLFEILLYFPRLIVGLVKGLFHL